MRRENEGKKEKLKRLKKEEQRIKKEGAPKRSRKAVKILGIGTAVFILAVYGAGVLYFQDRFLPGTTINGEAAGGKDAAYMKGIVKKLAETYSLIIEEKDGKTETIEGEDIDLTYEDDKSLEKLKKKQNPWIWPAGLFKDRDYQAGTKNSYNAASLEETVESLACLQEDQMTPAQDARVEDKGSSYEIIPEVEGNTLDREKTMEVLKEAVDSRKNRVSLEEKDCYVKPSVYRDDEGLKKEAEQLNKFTSLQVSLNFGTGTETITRDQLKAWLKKGEDGAYSFDEAKVKECVIGWSEKYNTYGKPRSFTTSGGYAVQLSGGDYGWRLWQDKTTESLVAALNQGKSGSVEPTWLYKGEKHGGNDIDGTYVEISIDQQRMWFYKNGTCLVDTPVVTGNPNKGNATPAGGVWRLKDKASPFTLVGKYPDGTIEYETPVNYWMPFNGGVGIHDLTSRSSFGGDIYTYNGSHGCINTPIDNVRVIYENIEVNTPIIVY